jgi:hypothetical protein
MLETEEPPEPARDDRLGDIFNRGDDDAYLAEDYY